ncbi:FecCD family ABC transporter permease [Spirochaeta cellobiosiphila]|uniref:FecCD family ABC transporter permease n=1 Tax=Spirochaeta cellobiosiphila TaxID=504483 RepID=UPI0003FA417F|nr:iron ABC transporter permease [Spirochaeta cellobiosiphila]
MSLNNAKAVTRTLLCLGLPLLIFIMFLSLTQGAAPISLHQIYSAFWQFEPDNMDHLMVRELRLARTLTAALIGMSLAMAGAIMQGVTGNPLADSGLMGLSAGGGFAVAVSMVFLPQLSYGARLLFSFVGSAGAALIVFGISYAIPGGKSPLKLILAGAAITTLLTALSQGIALYGEVSQNLSFWTMGSVSSTKGRQLQLGAPFLLGAALLSLALTKHLTLLALGEETAKSLGIHTSRLRFISILIVVILSGISTALAGVVSFVGIIVPHIARKIVGSDFRQLLPLTGLFGAILLVSADLAARFFFSQSDIPIGTLISLIGVPAFLYFARRERRR